MLRQCVGRKIGIKILALKDLKTVEIRLHYKKLSNRVRHTKEQRRGLVRSYSNFEGEYAVSKTGRCYQQGRC